jgi:hypothetical protein
MNKWQWLHHHVGGRARSTDRLERLHRLREAFNKIPAYILSQDRLSDEHKDALVAIVEGVIGAVSKGEAADYIRRLVEDRINEPLSGMR